MTAILILIVLEALPAVIITVYRTSRPQEAIGLQVPTAVKVGVIFVRLILENLRQKVPV